MQAKWDHIIFGIRVADGNIVINFGVAITSIELTCQQALDLAALLIQYADSEKPEPVSKSGVDK